MSRSDLFDMQADTLQAGFSQCLEALVLEKLDLLRKGFVLNFQAVQRSVDIRLTEAPAVVASPLENAVTIAKWHPLAQSTLPNQQI